jgi:hypothetical protein
VNSARSVLGDCHIDDSKLISCTKDQQLLNQTLFIFRVLISDDVAIADVSDCGEIAQEQGIVRQKNCTGLKELK